MASIEFGAFRLDVLVLIVNHLMRDQQVAFEKTESLYLCFGYHEEERVYCDPIFWNDVVCGHEEEVIGYEWMWEGRVLVHLSDAYHRYFTINNGYDLLHPEMLNGAQRYILLVDAKEYLMSRLGKVRPDTRAIFKQLLEEVLQALVKLTK